MTTVAVEAGRRAWSTLPRIRAWLEEARPVTLLAPAVAIQGITTLALALTVRHNGWLYYQGGDQLWYYISGWVLAHGQIPPPFIGHGLPALLAPVAALGGPTLTTPLPAIVLFNVLVLAPIALLCMYGIAKELGGRLFGYWVTLLWLAVPFIGIKYTDHFYHQRYTELTLPQAFGLTAMADFPSMVAVLVSVYFTLRVLRRFDVVDAIAAGLAAGTTIAIKPSNSVFLVGVILGLAYRRRLVGAALVLAGLAPAVLTLALWKYRGFGYLPLFRSEGTTQVALGSHLDLVAFSNPLQKYIHLNWRHLYDDNMLGIKEHFWSLRVIEWIVVAGLIGLARRSVTMLLVVGGWFAAFVLTKGTYAQAGIEDASLFRIMMPSYPAFVLLIASLVFLFPRRWREQAAAPPTEVAPAAHARRRIWLLGAAAAVFALYPLALVAAASPLRGPEPRAVQVVGLLRSVDPGLRLTASVDGKRVHLSWKNAQPVGTGVFYRVWRTNSANGGATCTPVSHGADNCELVMQDLGARLHGRFQDAPGHGRWTYRLGLAANWLNSPLYGDVYSIGPPIVVRVP
jgi:hypothetical protein